MDENSVTPSEATRLLQRLGQGDPAAADDLLPHLYSELRALAGSYFSAERGDHTLQPTALVHEAYVKLAAQTRTDWTGKDHFMAVAATAMRRILADHARGRRAAKRGGGRRRITLDEAISPLAENDVDMLELDEALTRLADLDQRKARVVELRFFGGLTNEEAAGILGVSRKTVVGDWTVARLWLRRELSEHSA